MISTTGVQKKKRFVKIADDILSRASLTPQPYFVRALYR